MFTQNLTKEKKKNGHIKTNNKKWMERREGTDCIFV